MSGKWGGGGTPCTACKKTCYGGELISYEKTPYHVKCFRCHFCSEKIPNTSQARFVKDEQLGRLLVCQKCFTQKGYVQKANKVVWKKSEKKSTSSSSKSKTSKFGGGGSTCFRKCGKSVYQAEQIIFEKKIFHPKCFTCYNCNTQLTNSTATMFKGNNESEVGIYCKKCWDAGGYRSKQYNTLTKVNSTQNSKSLTKGSGRYGGGGVPCHVCSKTVYMGEAIKFENKVYHEKCFSCYKCHNRLTQTQARQYEGNPYCSKCFKDDGLAAKQTQTTKKWTSKSNSKGSGSSKGSGKYGGGGSKCVICSKTVYSAEAIHFDKKKYHPKCFTCDECSTKIENLSSANCFENKIYCKKCWVSGGYNRKQLHTQKKGKGTSKMTGGSGKFGGGGTKCITCKKTVYPAEAFKIDGRVFHKKCAKCSDCGRKDCSFNRWHDNLICPQCWKRGNYSQKQLKENVKHQNPGKSKTKKTVDSRFKKFGGGGVKCYKCSKTCYPAETIAFEKHSWHTNCFKCIHKPQGKTCPREITIANAKYIKRGKDIDIYCKNCFVSLGLNRTTIIKRHTDPAPSEQKNENNEKVDGGDGGGGDGGDGGGGDGGGGGGGDGDVGIKSDGDDSSKRPTLD